MLIRIEAPITVIRNGKEISFKAGDVVQTSAYPQIEKLIKAQKDKGRVEK